MNEIIDRVKRSRRTFLILFMVYLVFNGIALFPIRLGLTWSNWMLNILVICVLWLLGVVMVGLFPEKPDRGILIAFMCQGAGLMIKVALAWGDEAFMSDLTSHNVSLYLLVIPVILYFSYLYHHKKYNQHSDGS